MINVQFDGHAFTKEMNNVINYSIGFIDGAKSAKEQFLQNLGGAVIDSLKNYIDVNARMNPETLGHVYEWYQEGSPEARLYDINYVTGGNGLSFNYTFRQSSTVKNGSKVPFYNKAEIMENGIPVTIKPKQAGGVLSFNANGQTVFTKSPIKVSKPGGDSAQGGFENTLDTFFNSYFSQSFLSVTGIAHHLENPRGYKDNLSRAKTGGKSLGFKVGRDWMLGAI